MGQLPKARDCAPSVFLAAPTFASYPALPNPFQNGLQVRAVNYYLILLIYTYMEFTVNHACQS